MDISNRDDIIDSRDVIKRIAELEGERDDLQGTVDARQEALDAMDGDASEEQRSDAVADLTSAKEALAEWDTDNGEELKALQAFAEDASGYAEDWHHGATLIRDSYFEDYARELADDLHGRAVRDASWPFDCIDWEKAADALKADYTSAEFDGVTYWVR